MAIAATHLMSTHQEDSNSSSSNNNNNQPHVDDHGHDVVMPGFRFHPTEEELIEFYLRRKVEGKHFNVEIITFLDLYRYDPWELPALAAIGEKEWYFYVPRDKKYRNGDRPNRVTTSGYWKATGADKTIKSESFRSIGIKKTLVFYSGKAPKGIRTSWIMNEYRLPLLETERIQKAEISLCRVYKRAGIEDHPSLPTRTSCSKSSRVSQPARNQPLDRLIQATYGGGGIEGRIGETSQSSSNGNTNHPLVSLGEDTTMFLESKPAPDSFLTENCTTIFANTSSNAIDDLHHLVNGVGYRQHESSSISDNPSHFASSIVPISLTSHFPSVHPQTAAQSAFSERLWDWNVIQEGSKDYTSLFK